MHGALRSLIIPFVLGTVALAAVTPARAQDSQVTELPVQVQEQSAAQSEPSHAPAQAQEQRAQTVPGETTAQAQPDKQEPEHVATELKAAPEPTAAQPLEPRQEQASRSMPEPTAPQPAEAKQEQALQSAPEQSRAQPSDPEQQASRAAPEQSTQQATEPAAKVDLSSYAPGTIVVETSERKLHLVLANGEVLSYPVGVGKRGKSWAGTGAISGKYLRPAWSPPRALKREKPWTPDYIPGGSPRNPMGAAAMTLSVDQYAIHGTNDDGSIGGFVSFGCIRMHNRDILDLYKRVRVGTRVVVLR